MNGCSSLRRAIHHVQTTASPPSPTIPALVRRGNGTATNINGSALLCAPGCSDKILQVIWAGAKYSVIKDVDVVGAYYHYTQNNLPLSAANICGLQRQPAAKAIIAQAPWTHVSA